MLRMQKRNVPGNDSFQRSSFCLHPSHFINLKALRHKKDRPEELLRALRYEKALSYEDLGQWKRERSEFEELYAEVPDYEDVAIRMEL